MYSVVTLNSLVLRLYFHGLSSTTGAKRRYTFSWILRRAASQIVLLVLLFVPVQPSVAKVVAGANPSAVSLAVSDRSVALTEPNERSSAAHPILSTETPR